MYCKYKCPGVKHLSYVLCFLTWMTVCMGNAYAESTRVVIDTPNGQNSCIMENNTLTDCVPVNSARYEIVTSKGRVSCLRQNGSYVDCKPVTEVQAVPEGTGAADAAVLPNDSGAAANALPAEAQADTSSIYDHPEMDEEYKPSYWDNDYGIPNGLIWGATIGWFGEFYKGSNDINSLSFGGNVGWKYRHFGFSVDGDFAYCELNGHKGLDYWTMGIAGLLMMYLPLTDGIAQTIGFGIGYTGWSVDENWTTYSIGHSWLTGYYVEENDYTRTIEEGGFLSLKLKARLDVYIDDMLVGIEFVWIPWIDTDRKKDKIINNVIGIQLDVGQIIRF